jgi:uncharacterized membrane protein YhaH (DUF805 family)
MEQRTSPQPLQFTQAFNLATSRIFQIDGRSRRSEFWWMMLLVCGASIILTPLAGLVLELLTIPLKVRRLHDIGKSGWWLGGYVILFFVAIASYTFSFIIQEQRGVYMFADNMMYFFILLIVLYKIGLIVLYCLDSVPYENQYGPSPKYQAEDDLL